MSSILVKTLYFWFLFQVELCLCQNEGWIPLTKEDAYDKILREPFARFLVGHNYFNHQISPGVKELKNDAIKMATPQNNFQLKQDNAISIPSIQHPASRNYQNLCTYQDCDESENREHEISSSNDKNGDDSTVSLKNKTEINIRKPKHITTDNGVYVETNAMDRVFPKDDANEENVKYEVNYTNGKNRIYKVIEDNPESDTTDDAAFPENSPEIDSTNQNGYVYEPPTPDAKHSTDSNITNNFLGILSKYNIKPRDHLPNYILSRRHRDWNRNYVPIPFALKIPPRLNSLNHLAADPLLAVFLSNYGYYLPGLYGIQSKYRNLYGYLASNNIHNNKPFGSYKIFSDTDSSN